MRMPKARITLVLLLGLLVLLLATTPAVLAGVRNFNPDYNASFDGAITGGGFVEHDGYRKGYWIHSNVCCNNYPLRFDSSFGSFGGDHLGYLAIFVDKRSGDAEFKYTFGPEEGIYYHLHGFGRYEGNRKQGWFTLVSGGTFSISESVCVQGEGCHWEERWSGSPSFTVYGQKR